MAVKPLSPLYGDVTDKCQAWKYIGQYHHEASNTKTFLLMPWMHTYIVMFGYRNIVPNPHFERGDQLNY